MADRTGSQLDFNEGGLPRPPLPIHSIDEARALAKQRFKEKLLHGEQIGGCSCHDEDPAATEAAEVADATMVAGVRFRDSGRIYYFSPGDLGLTTGDWVVVETARGREAGRVVLAPHQLRLNQLQGELKPVLRQLDDDDIRRMNELKQKAAGAVKTFGAKIRERHMPMKAISADYNYDGTQLTLNFSAPERVDFRELAKNLSQTFHCRVELRQVGPRDEARLLGGLGRCGRTLCCASWLPVYPDISMNMAKTQDLPLNPSKVSGVCGRLLCCLSYENEQYRQMKAVLPRLGQTLETPQGPGMVVSLQVLKQLVTVRLQADNSEAVFTSVDLGLGEPAPAPVRLTPARQQGGEPGEHAGHSSADDNGGQAGGSRRRRRRRGKDGEHHSPAS